MSIAACSLLLIGIFAYIFYPERHVERQRTKSRLDFLLERERRALRESS